MNYMLMIYGDPNRPNAGNEMAEYLAFTADMRERGIYIAGEALQAVTTARTVRTNGTQGVMTDGPFAETREVLGGFYLLECKDFDEAAGYAKRINAIDDSTVEIRAIWEFPKS